VSSEDTKSVLGKTEIWVPRPFLFFFLACGRLYLVIRQGWHMVCCNRLRAVHRWCDRKQTEETLMSENQQVKSTREGAVRNRSG
jgi:hypothetical protein